MWRCPSAVIAVVLLSSAAICVAAPVSCTATQYKVKEKCCPMCNPGYHVYRHCTEYSSTGCAPCPTATYTDALNSLKACSRCTGCDSAAGLRVKKECSSTSDALCEPLEGHYCTDPIKDGCRGAVEHTKCLPGQYIKQPGSASSDTVCEDCGDNTYSDGTSCRPHTRCESRGLWTRTAGTDTADAECEKHYSSMGIWVALSAVAVFVVMVVVDCWRNL